MNVADRGMQIVLLYLRMSAYVSVAIQLLTNVNQVCSSNQITKLGDGLQYISVSIKGAYVMIVLNVIAFIYVKAKDKIQMSDNALLAFINVCWGMMQFMKSYQAASANLYECDYVINGQQITFYFHAVTLLQVQGLKIQVLLAFFFSQIIMRIVSLPINCVSLYLIFVNNKQDCIEDNIYYLLLLSAVWLILLGVPYNFFMSANRRISGPYAFLSSIGILIQIPVCVLIYYFGLNYKNDSCQIAYSSLEVYLVLSVAQLIMQALYFIYYKKFEKEKQKEISNNLINLTSTSKLSTTLYTIKK